VSESKRSRDGLKRLRYTLFEEKQLAHLLEQIAEWECLFNKHLVLLAEKESFDTSSAELSEACSDNAVSLFRMPLMRSTHAQKGKTYELSPEEFPSEAVQHFEAEGDWVSADTGVFASSVRPDIIVERYASHTALKPYDEVKAIASKLCSSQAELMHILPCQGFYSDVDQSKYYLVFDIPNLPTGIRSFCSLQNVLSQGLSISLNARLRFAVELATAVWYVHSGQTVHKAIHPQTIYIVIGEHFDIT
jgi:hypothetical protein